MWEEIKVGPANEFGNVESIEQMMLLSNVQFVFLVSGLNVCISLLNMCSHVFIFLRKIYLFRSTLGYE